MEKSSFNNYFPAKVSEWLKESGFGEIKSVNQITGGCINNAVCITTTMGKDFFLKTNNNPKNMFVQEAEGLKLLNVEGGPRIPHVHLWGDDFILLEFISQSIKEPNYWENFGEQLAKLHQKKYPRFGLDKDNYIGSNLQINSWTKDGFDFFGTHRLIFQAEMATHQSLLTSSEANRINNLAKKLPNLLPTQMPVLIHGDLWSGNVISGPNGEPVIIDPAVYYGWAEAELAMTILFGRFPIHFYDQYENTSSIEPGWRDRADIYNLYHLLNHLNIFGMSYHSRVIGILNKYL